LAKRVIAVPDLHFPWHHAECLAWIYSVIANFKPDIVIQMGDLYDMYSSSRFARTHNLMTPKQEIAEARMGAEAFWKNVRINAPKARRIQKKGNHDIRPDKRILEEAPELEDLINTSPLFQFTGVETIHDPSEETVIDNVIYIHGHLTKMGDHVKYFLQSVVHGHSHRGGTHFMKLRNETIWELDCGFCSDESAVPLRYGPARRTLWTLGVGIIDEYGPRFLPYPGKRK
jgi:hypothetical protein